MDFFQIRILSPEGTPLLLFERQYLNGNTAITAAQQMAQGRPFEVWDDEGCISVSESRLDRPAA